MVTRGVLSVVVMVLLVVLGSVTPVVAVASTDSGHAGGEATTQSWSSVDGLRGMTADRRNAVGQVSAAVQEWVGALQISVGASERGALGPTGGAFAAVEPVDGCRVIDSPGSYALVGDITDSTNTTCIDIRSSDVVFDGNGHTIDGVEFPNRVGVRARNGSTTLSNVTVRNLSLSLTGGSPARLAGVPSSTRTSTVASSRTSSLSATPTRSACWTARTRR